MKKILLLILSFNFLTSYAHADSGRIGLLDMEKVNKQARVVISLNKQKDIALERIKKEVDEKRKEFEKKESELKTKQSVLDEAAFIKEARAFQMSLLEFDKQTERKVSAVERGFIDALKSVQSDYLNRIVKKIGKDRGFDMVVSSQTAIVIDESLDITEEVVNSLNKEISEKELKIK